MLKHISKIYAYGYYCRNANVRKRYKRSAKASRRQAEKKFVEDVLIEFAKTTLDEGKEGW
jgi:hypothetical protein